MTSENYILLNDEQGAIIVPEKDTFKATCDGLDCVWVKKELFEEKGKTFSEKDEAVEYYEKIKEFSYNEIIPEPEEGEYICVYTDDGEAIGEDPYFWDYNATCYKWWDGSNWQLFCSDDIEELEIVDTITKNKPDFNFGRAIHCHIFRNESDEYIVGFENDGYYDPICEEKRFTNKAKAIEYIENLIA